MSESANLTIKLPLALKEQIKALAEGNSVSMSAEITGRLERSLGMGEGRPEEQVAAEIDNQYTKELTEQPFTSAEIKKLRALLHDGANKKKAKKK